MSEELEKQLRNAEKEIERLKKQLEKAEEENAEQKQQLATVDKLVLDSVREIFGPYMTDEVLEDIVRHKGKVVIGGERRHVTMMFTDRRRSTELSEQMEPLQFIDMLNHYISEMIEIVNSWQGNILDFVGDAIVVVFGAPRINKDSARDAVACAVSMQRRMEAVNAWNRERGYPELAMGIGIHSGSAILGNIGSETRRKYDMIGRNVNLASRIEGYTEGGQILVSSECLRAAGELVHENPDGRRKVRPKGIRKDIMIHEVVGFGKRSLAEEKEHD